jgi:hypothetical protein
MMLNSPASANSCHGLIVLRVGYSGLRICKGVVRLLALGLGGLSTLAYVDLCLWKYVF